MNIVYLDRDPKIAAQMMCDKHVVKMILESAQMLSTAHRVCDGDKYADQYGLYKMAHKNHPSTKWVRSGGLNYLWLYKHMRGLMQIWLANMDFQLVIDLNKVVGYMTKYVCKPEMEMTKGLSKMVQKIINVEHHRGLGPKGILKKILPLKTLKKLP